MKLAFIGSGNVAWHLSQGLENAGFPVVAIYSRTLKNAQKLAARMYDATATDSLDFSESEATVFFICVKDDALPEVCYHLQLPATAIVVHTSGSLPLSALQLNPPVSRGVFYPLQTFSQSRAIDISQTPLCLEAEDPATEAILVEMAQKLSKIVYLVSSQERKALHLSAVFACNFVNHLWAVAKQLLDAEHLEFDLLKPLIRETLEKALAAGDPAQVQTGPAARHDLKLIQTHLAYLQKNPAWQHLYQVLSDSILHQTGR